MLRSPAVPSTTSAAPDDRRGHPGQRVGIRRLHARRRQRQPGHLVHGLVHVEQRRLPRHPLGPASPIIVTGLSNGHSYTVQGHGHQRQRHERSVCGIGRVRSRDGPDCTNYRHGREWQLERVGVVHAVLPATAARSPRTRRRARRMMAEHRAPHSGAADTDHRRRPDERAASTRAPSRATNAVGTGPSSALSHGFVVGQPGAPTGTRRRSGLSPGTTGPLQVLFTPGSPNGSADDVVWSDVRVDQRRRIRKSDRYRVSDHRSGTDDRKDVQLHRRRDQRAGTSFPSVAGKGLVGAPAAPTVVRVLPIKHGVALPFTAPANNGAAISNYRARCTSTDGGAPGSPLQSVSPIVATSLTDGKTYTCVVTANNARGEAPRRPPPRSLWAR